MLENRRALPRPPPTYTIQQVAGWRRNAGVYLRRLFEEKEPWHVGLTYGGASSYRYRMLMSTAGRQRPVSAFHGSVPTGHKFLLACGLRCRYELAPKRPRSVPDMCRLEIARNAVLNLYKVSFVFVHSAVYSLLLHCHGEPWLKTIICGNGKSLKMSISKTNQSIKRPCSWTKS
jgi:hypothetical protein